VSNKYDKELGLDQLITRRDFVYGSSLLLGGALTSCATGAGPAATSGDDYSFSVGGDWYGPGGSGDYALSHGNTPDLIQAAHEIRAGRFKRPLTDAIDSGEDYDLVIVGGGFSGLSAAHHFQRLNPTGRALIIDNHPIFGGEAKRNDFVVNGVHLSGPQGSNDFAVQRETGDPDDYFTALNIPREFEFAEPGGAAAGMRIPFDNYDYMHWHHDIFDVAHYFAGASTPLVKDLWRTGLAATPWDKGVQESFLRLRRSEVAAPDGREQGPWLDSMTINQYYENVLGLSTEVSRYYDPIMASIIGLGGDAISAYWGNYFAMPGFVKPQSYTESPLKSFPGGNAGIARHFVKKMIPGAIGGTSLEDTLFSKINFDALDRDGNTIRIRLNSTAVRIAKENRDRVRVTYTRNGEVHQLKAKAVVMASGGWVNKHVIVDLPQSHQDAYDNFAHSPVLVANVALNNWHFLERLGVSAAIWSGGFGFTCNIRRPMVVGGRTQPLHPDKPIVLTFYAPIYKPGLPLKQQGIVGRAELLGTSFTDYERQIREQMTNMFAAGGFDPTRDIAGIILNRWGHAYVNPGPGFIVGTNGEPAPPDIIRQPHDRIAFGHSELRGHQYWTGAAGEGRRAVESLLDAYF
jgi:spermidine dehydrogenase